MEWHLFAEIALCGSAQDGEIRMEETTLTSLAKLGLAPDVFARISAALNGWSGSTNRPKARVWVAKTSQSHPPNHDWRFFIVTPGSPAAGDQAALALELYLY